VDTAAREVSVLLAAVFGHSEGVFAISKELARKFEVRDWSALALLDNPNASSTFHMQHIVAWRLPACASLPMRGRRAGVAWCA
jgi:hypothetical protein